MAILGLVMRSSISKGMVVLSWFTDGNRESLGFSLHRCQNKMQRIVQIGRTLYALGIVLVSSTQACGDFFISETASFIALLSAARNEAGSPVLPARLSAMERC